MHEGQLKVANAAWWGFDDKDSTNALQSAINSGAEKVIVPFMGYDWAVRPIYLASDQEIYFEPGVVIIAKKGQFKNNHDSVFRANGKKNITLSGYGAAIRMHKEDYRDPNNYEQGEWRMGIYLVSCSNIKVLGLTIADTGGDGIYLGENRNPAFGGNTFPHHDSSGLKNGFKDQYSRHDRIPRIMPTKKWFVRINLFFCFYGVFGFLNHPVNKQKWRTVRNILKEVL